MAAEYTLTDNWTLFGRSKICSMCNTRIRRAFFVPVPVSMAESASMSALALARTANLDKNRGGNVNKPDDQPDLLAGYFADTETAWSIGSFGVIAEFMRDADEDCRLSQRADGAIAAVTARGGLRLRSAQQDAPVRLGIC